MLDDVPRSCGTPAPPLVERYDGRFHNSSLRRHRGSSTTARYLDLLVRDFPRFDDVAEYDGHTVRFHKLVQLASGF